MGAAAIPLVVSLAGTAAQYVASEKAANQRQGIANQMDQDRATFGQQNRDLTTNLAQQYDPTTRLATLNDLAGKRQDTLTRDQTTANANIPTAGYTGKISSAYGADKAATGAIENARTAKITQLLANVLAPTDLRAKEGFRTADTSGRLNTLRTDLSSVTGGRASDLASVEPDPLLNFGGSVAQGVGAGMAASDYQTKRDKLIADLFKGRPGTTGTVVQPNV